MKWTVVWSEHALDQLANIWLSSEHRDEVTRASKHLDVLLRSRPLEVGEARTPPERVLFEKPLAILYEAIEADCLVTVIAAWQW